GSAAAKKAWASGERITSNIGAHLAPVHAFARSDRLLGGGQTLRQRRTIQELNKFSQRHQALGRQAIDVAFDPAAEFNGAHGPIIRDCAHAGHAVARIIPSCAGRANGRSRGRSTWRAAPTGSSGSASG